MIRVECPAPVEILPRLKSILEGYGANVTLETPTKGVVTHDCGTLTFSHSSGHLEVTVEHNAGFLPSRLIVGGIRQLIEETLEAYR